MSEVLRIKPYNRISGKTPCVFLFILGQSLTKGPPRGPDPILKAKIVVGLVPGVPESLAKVVKEEGFC